MVDIAHPTSHHRPVRSAPPAALPILRSQLVGQLLGLTAVGGDRRWTIDELVAATGGAYATVTREIRRLERAGLVDTEEIGRSKRVTLNVESPLYEPLAELMVRSFGPTFVVAEELGDLAGVEEIVIFGSWAARFHGERGPAANDIDVLILGTPDRDELHQAVRRAERRLGLPVNTTIRRRDDWAEADDAFSRSVKMAPSVRVCPPETS